MFKKESHKIPLSTHIVMLLDRNVHFCEVYVKITGFKFTNKIYLLQIIQNLAGSESLNPAFED